MTITKKRKKILVAMSGGVDSSVAAALLQKQGHEVIGVTFKLMGVSDKEFQGKGCCSACADDEAGLIAHQLGIKHIVMDERKRFSDKVMQYFVDEYSKGRTPNPCIFCNAEVKFESLMNLADELGCDSISTGHYARVRFNASTNKWNLMVSKDTRKDQSYVLYRLSQEQLGRLVFPLGYLSGKEETRKIAEELKMFVARKPDSQDICFVSETEGYSGFLRQVAPEAFRPGEIFNTSGKVIGAHQGLGLYTIGQRRRLQVRSDGKAVYVIGIDIEGNRLIVGSEDDLNADSAAVSSVVWTSIDPPADKLAVFAKIRYNMMASKAIIKVKESSDKVELYFKETVRAITPGQMAVFYRGKTVIGGGILD